MECVETKDFKNYIIGDIIGMVLGDGYIFPGTGQNCAVRITGTSKDYMLWKQSALEKITATKWYELEPTGFGTKKLYRVDSRRHPVYRSLRMRMYCENKRTIDEFVMKSLTPLGLLFWYLDDGNMDLFNGKGCNMMISSNAYSYAEHLLMNKMLYERFGLRFNIHQKFSKKRATRYCLLYLTAKDRLKFYDEIIASYLDKIPEDMMYKIPKREYIVSKMMNPELKAYNENIVRTSQQCEEESRN